MKRIFLACACVAAAGGAFASQVTDVTVNGVFVQAQVGSGNGQLANVGSINTSNTNVATSVRVNNVAQLQGGSGNAQRLQVGSILPSAPGFTALRTNVTVNGTVLQIQGGSANTQLGRIGVIY
jgi:hypothetical protein